MFGPAGITISDRMITVGDAQYEPQQTKIFHLTPRTTLLIAGDYAAHSQAIKDTYKNIRKNNSSPEQIALTYAQAIQSFKRRQAEDALLSPLGLSTDMFLARQNDMSPHFVDRITTQLQDFEGVEVEAIILGSDGTHIHLYEIDTHGVVSCMDDVGFSVIGVGAWHARSRLMQFGYSNSFFMSPALAMTFAAKKNAEVAPGVGGYTDIQIVLKDRMFPLWQPAHDELDKVYADFTKELGALVNGFVNSLDQTIVQIDERQRLADVRKLQNKKPALRSPEDAKPKRA